MPTARATRSAPALARPAAASESLYVPLDFVLVRAPLRPVEAYQALSAPDAAPPVQDAQVRRALAVGSQALAEAMERGARGALTARDAARLQAKLLRYLIRMSTRPTPYGLFAGVALGRWGTETDLALATTTARTRARPDMAWLWALVLQLEARPEVRRHLRLVANPAAFIHAGRVILTERAPSVEATGPGQGVSLRASGVVQRALAHARTPVPYGELAAYLLDTTPGATAEKVEKLLTELWQQTVLLTDLRPPLTTASPAHYVAARLSGIAAADDLRAPLEAVLDAAAAWDALPAAEGARTFGRLVAQAEQVIKLPKGDEALFQVDTALGLCGTQIQRAVGEEVARAAELLLRLSAVPQGIPYLAVYRQAFVARYGHDRAVPLLELLDPQIGLGPPNWHAGSTGIPHAQAMQRAQTQRDLAYQALYEHRQVVELDAATLARLETWAPTPATAPPSLDLYAFVAAASPEALDAGAFQVIVGPNLGVPAAGRNLGRFADLLGGEATAALNAAARAEEGHNPARLRAELVYLPHQARLANVAIRPAVRRYEIPLGASPGVAPEQVIPAHELTVGVGDDRFVVRWPAANAEILVTAGHMLNTLSAPPAGRFLADVGRERQAQLSGFDWGPAEGAPFLPRVQVGRIVLRPAQWTVGARLLPPEPAGAFADALDRWRQAWAVPRHVCLSRGDNRLILDLDSGPQVEELRTEIRGLGVGATTLLQEVLPALDQTWLPGPGGHYVTELVVSLVLRGAAPNGEPPTVQASPPDLPPAPDAERSTVAVGAAERLRPPGSDWLFAKLYCARTVEEDLIADPIRTFGEEALAAGWATDWFFIRYADPDPHLRLRFRGPPERLTGALLPAFCAWAADLMAANHARHFSFETYDREIERYGGTAGMEVAEAVFGADSRAVAALLQLVLERSLQMDRTTLAVLSVDDLLAGLGLDAAERLRWYGDVVVSRDQAGAEYRQRKGLLRALLGDPARLEAEPGGAALGAVLAARRAALAPIAARLAGLTAAGALAQTPATLCRSYVHLHCNRLLGVEAAGEQTVLGLLLRTREGLDRAPGR